MCPRRAGHEHRACRPAQHTAGDEEGLAAFVQGVQHQGSVNVADIAVGNERPKLKIANRVAVDPTIRITLPKSRMRVHVDDALPDLSGR